MNLAKRAGGKRQAVRHAATTSAANAIEVEQPVVLGSYNLGLTGDHVLHPTKVSLKPNEVDYFTAFTTRLKLDVQNAFSCEVGLHILFLCELGSQKDAENVLS